MATPKRPSIVQYMRSSLGLVFLGLHSGCSGANNIPSGAQEDDGRLVSWCQAQPGITRQQLLALMGPPSTALDTQMTWTRNTVQFHAFLDADGTAKQLDINDQTLSDAQKASLQCQTTRTRRSVAAAAAAKVAVAKPERKMTPACELVTAEEMSAILGATVVAEARDRSRSSTQCIYKPTSGNSPSVDFTFSWGDGKAAMVGMGLAGKHEPGMVSPYDGIGDQAGGAGPLLMIRTGDDLVSLVFSGVADNATAARKIFTTAKARM